MITHYACLKRMKNYLDLYSQFKVSPISVRLLPDQLRHLLSRDNPSVGDIDYIYVIPKAVYGIHERLLEWESLY